MSIRNILVSIEPLSLTTSGLASAVTLAERLGATVSGLAAARPWAEPSYTGLDPAASELLKQRRIEIEEALTLAEEHFRSEVPPLMQERFQVFVDAPTDRLIEAAMSADLIVLPTTNPALQNPNLHVDAGQLVLAAGRPLLVLGEERGPMPPARALVAWKDTKEVRRAVADAMPLLQLAEEVDVITVDEGEYGRERAELDSVVEWITSHGVRATRDVLPLKGTVAETLIGAAALRKCDLIVSGSYGHARLREWLFGGVTQDLLGAQQVNRLMAN